MSQPSRRRRWVEEKTAGLVQATEVASLAIDVIRGKGPDGALAILEKLAGGAYVVFPGNVGDYGALLRALQILAG